MPGPYVDGISALREQIDSFKFSLQPVSIGTVTEISDGIARISGLKDLMVGEMIEFEDDTLGMALNLEAESVGAIVLGDYEGIQEGSTVRALGQVVSVPVGSALLGRVIDALGRPIDGKGPIETKRSRPVERVAPGIIERASIDTPLQTGIKSLDALVPLGRGQRELIIGNRHTGKTTLAIDAIINQHKDDVLCIYVSIGQKLSSLAGVIGVLDRYGAMDHTVVVSADASVPAALQYIAPYAGSAISEEFMRHGRDVLIVYDDLTKHAWAYRQLSLLLRRPPGREAYPGDVFYLHSRLLERAAKLAPEYGGGSLTALPIIETQAGDMSAYIPTNVISITDGQIYLEPDLFNAGIRPAVNVGLSVSRVGGSAQRKAMRQVAGKLRLDLAQFRELEAFAKFGAEELDKATRDQLDRGRRITEMLKQPQYSPMSLGKQVSILFAVTNGYLDDVPVDKVITWEGNFHRFMETSHPEIEQKINEDMEVKSETEEVLTSAIKEFKGGSTY